ncbi:Ank 2 domain containing protein, partial [Asbolus verrucosus]
ILETEINEERNNDALWIHHILRTFHNACDQNKVNLVKKIFKYTPSLLKDWKEDTFSKESKNEFKKNVTNSLLRKGYNEFQDNKNELLFFAATLFEIEKLQELINTLSREEINQLRYTNSVIMFVLKYGDVSHDNFFKCIEILIENGVDINKHDIQGNTVMDYIVFAYENNKNDLKIVENLKAISKLLLNKGICKSDNIKTTDFLENVMKLSDYNYLAMDEQTQLFYWIIKNNTEEFINFKNIKNIDVDCDNGENTLLQFACKKSDKMLRIVKFLLENKADPNKCTKWNGLTPLELAGRNNNQKIFEEILKHKKTKVDQRQYNNFVKWRSQPMKVKLFEILLESNKLDTSLMYDKTGNTPLHYAIIFSHKKAIQNLLKRKSSLVIKNKLDVSPLDIIDQEDLKIYFDSCLALDNYTPYFSDINYKMKFRFNCLIDSTNFKEMGTVSQIGKSPNLEHLLRHPFIHTFISLKWFKCKFYYKVTLILQAFFFTFLSILFYHLPNSSAAEYALCIFLSFINFIIKISIFCNFRIKNRWPVFFVIPQATLHASTELLLIITTLGSFFQNQFRAFIFIQMAISFLLTAGYHPKLSKWSLMLQRVFKTFTILLLFFSLIVVAFSVGFHILFDNDEKFLSGVMTSVFKTYIMTTGEFDVGDIEFDSGFAGYLIFLIFSMSVSLVIVNFWTGVAVTDIERIEKDSEINAFKNVIVFILFIDYLYTRRDLKLIRKYICKPLLFFNIDSNNDIYHDKKRQFEGKGDFPQKIDTDCFNKIRLHYYKLRKDTNEKQIFSKLEEIFKILNELKARKPCQKDAGSSEKKTKKEIKKK